MNKVLVVDSNKVLREMWPRLFKGKYEIITASSVVEARQKFKDHSDIKAIVLGDLDLSVNNLSLSDSKVLSDLVVEFRETFEFRIITASTDPKLRRDLVSCGCDGECEKYALKDLLKVIF